MGSEEHDRPVSRTVPEALHGTRLDAAVRALFELSWGRARELVRRGKITAGGRVSTDASLTVEAGWEIALDIAARRARAAGELDPERVVHIDSQIVVIRKPAGIATVPFEPGERDTLDRMVRLLLARRARRGGRRRGALPSLLVVQRLDRGTSGLIVFARNMGARAALAEQFARHSVHRRYLALAHGRIGRRTFRSHLLVDRGDGIRGSSERSPRPALRRGGGGKSAVTHVEPLERLAGATLLACRLETGRTNQIRIHLSEAGHPLLGEKIYLRDFRGAVIPAPRLMLHAAELGFVHPSTGNEMRFVEELPADMREVLERLRPR